MINSSFFAPSAVCQITHRAYLHLLTPEFPPSNLTKNVTVPFPDGKLSLLHAIPAIGNKLCPVHKLGPQSQPTPASGTYHATIWFRFQ